MATEAEGRPDRASIILEDLHGTLQHLLLQYDVKSRAEVVEAIASDVDVETIIEGRDLLFQSASAKFKDQWINDMAIDLQLKARKGENAVTNYAKDVYDLYVYIHNEDFVFPKDLLKNGQLLDHTENVRESNLTGTVLAQTILDVISRSEI